LELLAAAQHEAAVGRERGQQLQEERVRVRELEACIAAAGGVEGGSAREMEFLRKERRAEVLQVEQEWRRRLQQAEEEGRRMEEEARAAAAAAAGAAVLHAKEVEAVRWGVVVVVVVFVAVMMMMITLMMCAHEL